MTLTKGDIPFLGLTAEVKVESTFDTRQYVKSYADLLTFTSDHKIPNRFFVSVSDADPNLAGQYECINPAALSDPTSWKKVGGGTVSETPPPPAPSGFTWVKKSGIELFENSDGTWTYLAATNSLANYNGDIIEYLPGEIGTVAPTSAGLFRIDYIYVHPDGTMYVAVGTASATKPQAPPIPPDGLFLTEFLWSATGVIDNDQLQLLQQQVDILISQSERFKYTLAQASGLRVYSDSLQSLMDSAEPGASIHLFSNANLNLTHKNGVNINLNGFVLGGITDSATSGKFSVTNGTLGFVAFGQSTTDVLVDAVIDQAFNPPGGSLQLWLDDATVLFTKPIIHAGQGSITIRRNAQIVIAGGFGVVKNPVDVDTRINLSGSTSGKFTGKLTLRGGSINSLSSGAIIKFNLISAGDVWLENFSIINQSPYISDIQPAAGITFNGADVTTKLRIVNSVILTANNTTAPIGNIGGVRVVDVQGDFQYNAPVSSDITFNQLTPLPATNIPNTSETVITAAALMHNVATPTDTLVFVDAADLFTITGFAGGSSGRVIRVVNASAYNMRVNEEDSNSSAANQVYDSSQGAATPPYYHEILPVSVATYVYIAHLSKWVLTSNPKV